MQSNERIAAALSALSPQIGLFRFAVSSTLERARMTLAVDSGPGHTGASLGEFASGRIDPERFAMISRGAGPLDSIGSSIAERAIASLEAMLATGDHEFVVDVEPGASPSVAIRAHMAKLGTVFGTASLVELVRRRSYDPVRHALPFESHPFEKWTAGERKVAPPLVIRLNGTDLDAFELAPLLDGCVRLILVVDDVCAPAPLARLVSPGVFVAQADDVNILDRLAGFDGPAIVAMMKGPEARFVHDPRNGRMTWQRTNVTVMPSVTPRKSLGIRSGWQQRDDIAHLKALAQPPALSASSTDVLITSVTGGNGDPAERLTAWLLSQSSLSGVS